MNFPDDFNEAQTKFAQTRKDLRQWFATYAGFAAKSGESGNGKSRRQTTIPSHFITF
jgi:hypothetical protein